MNPTIQKLQHELEHTADPRRRLPLLHKLGIAYNPVQPETGRSYARDQLRLAKELEDVKWTIRGYVLLSDWATIRAHYLRARRYLEQARSLVHEHPEGRDETALVYRKLGRTYIQLGKSGQALAAFNRALSVVGDAGETFDAAATYAAAGTYFQNFGQSARALGLFQQALRIFKMLDFPRGVGDMLSRIGSIHCFFGNPKESLENYRAGRDIVRKSGDRHLEALICKMMGDAYVMLEEFRQSLGPYETALRFFQELGDSFQWGQTLSRIGHVYASLADFQAASRHCHQARVFFERVGNDQGLADALTGVAEIQLYQKKYDAAVETFRRALELFARLGQPAQQSFVHKALAQTFEEMGRMEDSLEHYKLYMQFEHEIAGARVRQDLALIELEDRTREMERTGEHQRSRVEHLEQHAKARENELTVASLHLEQDKKLLEELRTRLSELQGVRSAEVKGQIADVVKEVDRNIERARTRESLCHRLENLSRDFVARLSHQCASLTSAEMRVCMLLKVNLSNKEIALLLGVSPRTLEGQRLSIRKKLGLKRKTNLISFLAAV